MSPDTPTIVFPDPGYFTQFDFPGRAFFKWVQPEVALGLYVTLLIAAAGTVLWRTSTGVHKHNTWLYWACALGALVFHAAYLDKLVEDSYITLRYAAHALEGHGLVWNVGEAPVEGFSNFLYTIVIVVLGAVGAPLADTARVVSLVASAGALVLLRRLCLRLNVQQPLADCVPLLVLSHPTVAAYAGAGLETSLYAFLIVLTIVTYTEGRMTRASAFAAAGWACRPDGVLVFAVLALVEGRRAYQHKTTDRLLRLCLPFLLSVAALTLFRFLYFGDVIPNSVRAKAVAGSAVVVQGVTYVLSSVGTAFTGFELLAVLGAVAIGPRRRPVAVLGSVLGAVGLTVLFQQWIVSRASLPHSRWTLTLLMVGGLGLVALVVRRLPRAWLPWLLFCVSLTAAVVVGGGDWMSGERYLAPVLFLLPALAAALLSSRWDTRPKALGRVLLVLGLCLVGFRIHATTILHATGRAEEAELNDFAVEGHVLQEIGLGHLTLAMREAGIRALLFKGPVLDMCGLSSRALATLPAGPFSPGHSRCNYAAALALRPPLSLVGPADETTSSYRLILVGLQRRDRVDYLELWARPDYVEETLHRLRSARLR